MSDLLENSIDCNNEKTEINEEKNKEETTVLLSAALKKTINKDLAIINGKVNNMDVKKMRHKFPWYNYENKDDIELYRKHLKVNLARIIWKHSKTLYVNKNVLPYYVVLDFEATCEAQNPPDYKHEIIEFPAILINSSTLQIEDKFRRICRPTIKTKLSEFCTTLTGITQSEVDNAEPFPVVLDSFNAWLQSHQLGTKKKFAIVTDGPWDMSRFLHVQCLLSNVEYPKWAEQWVDIRNVFGKFYQQKRLSLAAMLDFFGMNFEGRPHCGLDDATNIARVFIQIMCDGAVLMPNQTFSSSWKSTKSRIIEQLDPDRDLITQLVEMSLEAEKTTILPKGKLPVYRDIKKERSRKIHALTKNLDGNSELEEEIDGLGELQEEWKVIRVSRNHTKKGKNKTKKRYR